MAGGTGREGRPVHGGKVTSWLSKVFELNPAGLNWPPRCGPNISAAWQ